MSKDFNLEAITRKNVLEMKPYSSARSEFTGSASIFIDANESPYHTGANRYPDPLQKQLKALLAEIKNCKEEQLFIGNGSDEIIDLIHRGFMEPGQSNTIINQPTFGMYKVAAQLNDIEFREVLLTNEFQLNLDAIFNEVDEQTRAIFVCSPNNPTGNRIDLKDIESLLTQFKNLVIVDEAYIDFSADGGLTYLLETYPNLIILQTLSKGWGMAGARVGIAITSKEIVETLTKMKMPYNISDINQKIVIDRLLNASQVKKEIVTLVDERELLKPVLESFNWVEKVYPSQANFLLIKVKNATHLYQYLLQKGIVIRDRSNQPLLENCVRISIGLPEENEVLIEQLYNYKP